MMDEYDAYFQRFAEVVAAKLKEEDLLHLGDHMQPLSNPPLDVGYERVKEIIAAYTRTLVVPALERMALKQDTRAQEEVMLKDLHPGAVFVTREGVYAVKSEYRYSNEPLTQCECVLLASGEYAHFRDGNETLVREVNVEGLK